MTSSQSGTTSAPARRRFRLPTRQLVGLLALIVGGSVAGVLAMSGPLSANTGLSSAVGMYSGKERPANQSENDSDSVELGARFTVNVPGRIVGVRYFKSAANSGRHTGTLWDAAGHKLASANFAKETRTGWQTVIFSTPVNVSPRVNYVVSYHAPAGHYAQQMGAFSRGKTLGAAAIRGNRGVYAYGSKVSFPKSSWQDSAYFVDALFIASGAGSGSGPITSTPPTAPAPPTTSKPAPPTTSKPAPPTSTTPAPPSTTPAPPTSTPPSTSNPPSGGSSTSWPGASNTGVPEGVTLKPSKSFDINTDGTVIDGLDVSGCIEVNAKNVTIKNTRIRITGDCQDGIQNRGGLLTVQDTEIDGGHNANFEGMGWANFNAIRVNIHGTGDGIRANGNIVVRDSWIHDLTDADGSHNDGIQVTEGYHIAIVHNRIENPNSQTSAIMLGADQGSIGDITVDSNLLAGGGYALYGGQDPAPGNTISSIKLTNNAFSTEIFKNCGYYGPTTATQDSAITSSGNHWYESGKGL